MGAKTTDTSSTSTNSTTPDPNAYNAYLQALTSGQSIASTPYQPYTGNLVQGITPLQNDVMNSTTGITNALNTNANAATNVSNQYNANASGALGTAQGYAGNIAGNANVYQPYYGAAGASTAMGANMLTPGNFGSTVGAYMSPYITDVANATQNQFNNSNAQQSQALLSQGIQSGNAFGGDRQGVAQGILAGQQQTAEAPVMANIYNSGFNQASGEANTAASTALQAGSTFGNLGTGAEAASIAAPTAAAGVANAGYNTSNNALAGSLQGTQVSNQAQALQQANDQLQFGMGTTQQQTKQASDTAQYQQYQNQIAFPYEQTGWLGGLASTVGPPMGGTVSGSGTATVPAGNVGSSIAGGVTALTGLAGLLKRGGRVGSFAAGGAPGTGFAAPNTPGGDATWLIPAPPSGSKSTPLSAYQQPNTSAMANSIANDQSQAMSSLGKATTGLTNSSLGDSISDSIQDAGDNLGGLKRGGHVGHFDTGGTPSVATPATSTSTTPTLPTYGSTTDPYGNTIPNMVVAGTTENIPSPPQAWQYIGGSDTFGSVPAQNNAYSEALGAYYQQYPGAPGPGNPNPSNISLTPTTSASGSTTAGSLGTPASTPTAPTLPATTSTIATTPVPLTTLQVAAKRGGRIRGYDDGGDVSYVDPGDLATSYADQSASAPGSLGWEPGIGAALSNLPVQTSLADQYANQMPAPSTLNPDALMQASVNNAPVVDVARDDMAAASGANDNSEPVPQQATGTYGGTVPSNWFSRDPNAATVSGYGSLGAPAQNGTVDPGLFGAGNLPAQNAVAQAYAPSIDGSQYANQMPVPPTFAPPNNPPMPPARPDDLGVGSLAAAPASYPGAHGASMYTGPVRVSSTGNAPIVSSGSIAALPQSAVNAGNGSFLTALKTIESGGRNIPNTHEGTTSGQAQGYDQITTGTWKDFAPKAGVDLAKYPTALSAPQSVQDQVAGIIPLGRWDPITLNKLRAQGYSVDTSKTLNENIAANGGAAGSTILSDQAVPNSAGNFASIPQGDSGTPASPQQIAQTAATADRGTLLDKLGIHLSKDASLALMSAGFGMMASRSPFMGQGIGEGAQKGLQTYMQAQQLDRQNALAGAQIGNLQSETSARNVTMQLSQQQLAIRKAALKAAYPELFGEDGGPKSVADGAAGLGKAVAAGAAAGRVPPVTVPSSPSPTTPVAPIAGATETPIPDDQNPVVLRAQAARVQRQANLLGLGGDAAGSERLQATAQQFYSRADEVQKQGGYTVADGNGGVKFVPLQGFNEAQAQKAAATTGATTAVEKNYTTQNEAKVAAAAEAKEGQQTVAQANAMLDVMFDPKTGKPTINAGPLGPQITGAAALLKQAGLSDGAIQTFLGTNPTNGQELEKLRTVLGSEVARQALQGSPVRVAEFNRFLATTPSDELLPQSFKWIVQNTILPKAQQQIGAYKAVEDADPGKDNIQGKLFDYSQEHPWYKGAQQQQQTQQAATPPAAPAPVAAQAQAAMDAWDKSGQPPDVIAAAKAKIMQRLQQQGGT